MFNLAVFAIIKKGQQVLLCHRRDYDLWNMPGGGVEEGEDITSALTREVKEETGLQVKIDKLTGVYSKSSKNSVVFSFLCHPTGGEITLTDEANQIEYFSVDDLPSNLPPKQVERLTDYFSQPQKVHLKTQSGPSSIDLVKQGKL